MGPNSLRNHITSFHGLDFNLACRILYDKSLLQKYRLNAGFNDTPGQCGFCGKINSLVISHTRNSTRKSWKTHVEKCAAHNLSKLVNELNCSVSTGQPTVVEVCENEQSVTSSTVEISEETSTRECSTAGTQNDPVHNSSTTTGQAQVKQEVVADLELEQEQESAPARSSPTIEQILKTSSDENCSLGSTPLESCSEEENENPPPLESLPTSQEHLNRDFKCFIENRELKQALADTRSELKTKNETIEKLAAENKRLVTKDKNRRKKKQDENTNKQTQKSLEDAKTTINAQKRLYSALKTELGKRSSQVNEMQEQNKLLKEQNTKLIEELYALKDKYILQLEQNQK